MKKQFCFYHLNCLLTVVLSGLFMASATACKDNDEAPAPGITIDESQKNIEVVWNENEASVKFTVTAAWSVTAKDAVGGNCTWLKLNKEAGESGTFSIPVLLEPNDAEVPRTGNITLCCEDVSATFTLTQGANPDAVLTLKESDIPDFDRYYKPAEFGQVNMLRSDAKWSWWRARQSEHFVVFWEPGFGANPNAESVPEALRVDIDDLLDKAEQFYRTNTEALKFAETGQHKSYLDKYKMEIYLLYQAEWLATGAGYDNVIGALWVNPSTCKPVGSTIAHEIGHSFQYQVYCDKLLNGATGNLHQGFRYGYGANGEGGNTFWEQCAQWQSFRNYPEELFGHHISVWKANCHRHFNHEWMRYASYWLPYYWAQKHGIGTVGSVWAHSLFPEDPLMAYQRLYCNGNLEKLYEELYDYAARMVTYDVDVVRNYATESARNYSTKLFESGGGYYQVGYASCPGTSGFNIIPLNLPEGSSTVGATFEGLTPGSALPDADPGKMVDGNGKEVGTTRNYNLSANSATGWRYGFVSVANGKPHYSPMYREKSATLSYSIPAGTTHLYMVVMGAPGVYEPHPWNDNEADDAQWPYRVKFEGTDLLGSFFVDETAEPKDITLTYDLNCNASSAEYALGTLNLSLNQQLAQAFAMKPATMVGKLLEVGKEPSEGKIAIALALTDGTYSYAGNANNGFWCTTEGNVGSWANGGVFFEFNGLTLTYGHRPDKPADTGTKAVMRPTFIYTRNNVQYKATIVLNMQF